MGGGKSAIGTRARVFAMTNPQYIHPHTIPGQWIQDNMKEVNVQFLKFSP